MESPYTVPLLFQTDLHRDRGNSKFPYLHHIQNLRFLLHHEIQTSVRAL